MRTILLMVWPLLLTAQDASQGEVSLDLVPQEGVMTRRVFVAKHDLSLEGFRQQLDKGEPIDLPGGARFTSEQRFVFDDLAGPALGLVPLTLQRRFIALESRGSLAPPDTDNVVRATAQSSLVGASVQMTWVPEEQAHGRYYDAREEAEELLLSMSVDPWLTWIAPREIGRNGSWKIPAADLQGLIAPGGSLGFSPGTERTGRRLSRTLVNGVGGGLEMAFGGRSTGELSVRPLGLQTDGEGTTQLVFALSLNAQWVSDVTERLNQTLLPREREQGSNFERASLSLGLSGRGKLLADPKTGRPLSLELNCTETVSMNLTEILETGARFNQEMAMRGRLTLSQRVLLDK
jgi:hypothetical protein